MAGKKVKNMEEFAEVSGISRPTVSKYFNDPESVRASTRQRIEAALETYDYTPNIYAINQNRRLTKNIGIVVPYLADPFFAEIARRIETLVIDAGYRPILLSSHGDPDHEVGNLESLKSIRPAGVLFAPLGRATDRAAAEAFATGVPVVNFDANIDGLGDIFIGHNNVQATKIMIEYLVRSGEPPVFFEMRTAPNPNVNKRRSAYLEAMTELGHPPDIIQIEGEGWNLEEIGYEGARKALTDKQLTTNTVLCSNDRLAIGFVSAAFEMGMKVGRGEDCVLRVAGHDNHPFSRFTCPSLTTISHNYDGIASAGVDALMRLIDSGEHSPTRDSVLLDGELIMRASA